MSSGIIHDIAPILRPYVQTVFEDLKLGKISVFRFKFRDLPIFLPLRRTEQLHPHWNSIKSTFAIYRFV